MFFLLLFATFSADTHVNVKLCVLKDLKLASGDDHYMCEVGSDPLVSAISQVLTHPSLGVLGNPGSAMARSICFKLTQTRCEKDLHEKLVYPFPLHPFRKVDSPLFPTLSMLFC